jgi:hypothetical protein
MSLEFTGSIYRIDQEEIVSASFKKRLAIIKTDESYPQFIAIEFQQDRVDLIDPYKVGDNVTVSFNLSGRLWSNPQGEEKCFNTIKCWKIQRVSNAAAQTTPTPSKEPVPTESNGEPEPDLPF